MTDTSKDKRIWWVVAVGALAFLFAIFSEWNDDAIAYSFFIPRYGEDESFTPIRNLVDIWHSQINHYFNANGRFVVHLFVQFFCGIGGKFLFALCNAIVWMILTYNVSGFPGCRISSHFPHSIFPITLSVILFWSLPFTPPFQINYVWVSCVVVYWIRLFFSDKRRNPLNLILLAIFSVIAGELHEGFSIPLGAAIIASFLATRCRFNPAQWIMAICFGIGAIITILAPGNFSRMDVIGGGDGASMLNLIEQLPSLIWFPLIYVLVRIFSSPDDSGKITPHFLNLFLVTVIAVSAAFNLYVGNLGRGIIPYNLAFILLTAVYLTTHTPRRWLKIAAGGVALVVICWRGYETHTQNVKTRTILEEYTPSDSGRIFIDDNLFLFNLDETCRRRNTYTNLLRSRQRADKPFLVIYPESIKDVDLDKDTNMVLPIGDQSWICVRSATHPAEFLVEKTLLPGILNRQLAPRSLDFSSTSDIFIDSTANNTTVVYHNRRPYMKAAIRQTAAHTEE